jgi:hypothetical protein
MDIRLFLRKTFKFLGIPLLVYLLLFIALNFFLNKKPVFSKGREPLNKACIFMGDSHIAESINDSLLPCCQNVGLSSESLYFTYFKLKRILQTTPSIKNVYLGFSYHSISGYYGQFIYGEYSNAISSKYFYLLPPEEKSFVLRANKQNFFSYIKAITSSGFMDLVFDRKAYLGGYDSSYPRFRPEKAFIDKRILVQFYTNNLVDAFEEINIEYLRKIQLLCKQSNVNLMLVNTPLHEYYRSKVPAKFVEKYKQIIRDLHLPLLDLSAMPLEDSCYVFDGEHVTKAGAILVTKYIVSHLDGRDKK